MAKEKLYACSVQAGQYVWGQEHDVFIVRSTSKKAALELVESLALSQFPREKGYKFYSYKIKIVYPTE